jgi:hypothetical protein
MTIIENSTLHYTPIDNSHEEFDGTNYHIYFAYNIEQTATSANNIQVTVTDGPQPISITAEHCTHPEMVAQGNIYVIHIVLSRYDYMPDEDCNRLIRVTGGWGVEELPIDIPISTQVLQIGCELPRAHAFFKVREEEAVVDSDVPYEFGNGAEVVLKNRKYYVKISTETNFIKLTLDTPILRTQTIEVHTMDKKRPEITGRENRDRKNVMTLEGGESGDYTYVYTTEGRDDEYLVGYTTFYLWRGGSATYIRSIEIK